MKKLTVCALFICIITPGWSQITKGNWLVGGNLSFSTTKYNSLNFGPPHSATSISISPNIGYFLLDKFAGGAKVNLNYIKGDAGSYTDFLVGPFVRYYFLKPEARINILSEGFYQAGFEKGTNKVNKSSFGFNAGPAIFFNNVAALEFLVGYNSYKFTAINGRNNTIKFSVGFQIHLEKDK